MSSKRPLILKKMIIKPDRKNIILNPKFQQNINFNRNVNSLNNQLIKLASVPLFREDVIFESKDENFLSGEYHSITIINKLNNLTNNCKTIAKCVTLNKEMVEKTSDNLTQLIGHEAYNTLFHALCSVINLEYRIKGILALLTPNSSICIPLAATPNPTANDTSKTINRPDLITNDQACQTDETRIDIKKKKERRRIRKVLAPYVVKPEDIQKRVIINPHTCIKTDLGPDTPGKSEDITLSYEETKPLKTEIEDKDELNDNSNLLDLGYLHDENSRDSLMTSFSFITTTEILQNPLSITERLAHDIEKHTAKRLEPVHYIDKHTKKSPEPTHSIMLNDRTVIKVPYKPEDVFHIATKENLEYLDKVSRTKLMSHQMQIDYQHCCSFRDEDGNLPIHLAVINEDVEFLKRQCVVLKWRNQSVDIPAHTGLTALKLSIDFHTSPHSVSMLYVLLQNGADPFLTDERHRTSVHLAAELKSDHLAHILLRVRDAPRTIIADHVEDLQKPGWQEKSDNELSNLLLEYISTLYDKQGDNPLMLASKHGHYENVRLLLEAVPTSANLQNPSSGNTALLFAVAAACNLSAERGNKSKIVDHFRMTIELLLESGADPAIENNNGCSVTLLLSEFGCAELSIIVANKVTCSKLFEDMDPTLNLNNYHLLKEGDNITIQEFKKKGKLRNYRKPIVLKELSVKNEIVTDVRKCSATNVRKDIDTVRKDIDTVRKDIDTVRKDTETVRKVNETAVRRHSVTNVRKGITLTPVKRNTELTVQPVIGTQNTHKPVLTIKKAPIALQDSKPVIVENILLTPAKVNDAGKVISKDAKATPVKIVNKNVILCSKRRTAVDNFAAKKQRKK